MIYLYTLSTLLVFLLLKKMLTPIANPLANPLLWSIVFFIILFSLSRLSFTDYQQANKIFVWLLEPAIVALALPLFQQLQQIRQHLIAVLISCSVGVVVAMSSGVLVAYCFSHNQQLLLSILPKSVTSPIAMAITAQAGGIPSLAAAIVIGVGLLGACFGTTILRWANVNNPQAQGLAMGCSAHAIGTAKAAEIGPEQGGFSSLALIVSGIITALLAPVFIYFIELTGA